MNAFIETDMPLVDEIDWLGPVPAKAKKRGNPEMKIQQAIVAFLRRALPTGSIVSAIQNERGASGATEAQRFRFGQLRQASGILRGFPDLQILLQGRVIFFEVKAPAGRLSDSQTELHPRIRALGHPVYVVRSIEDVEAALRGEFVQLRATAGRRG